MGKSIDRKRFFKLMALFESDQEAEVLAAVRACGKMLEEAGTRWCDVEKALAADVTLDLYSMAAAAGQARPPQQQPPPAASASSYQTYRDWRSEFRAMQEEFERMDEADRKRQEAFNKRSWGKYRAKTDRFY